MFLLTIKSYSEKDVSSINFSLNLYFNTLPCKVLGNTSVNFTISGTLYFAMLSSQNARISSSVNSSLYLFTIVAYLTLCD